MKRIILTVLLTALVILGIGAINNFIQNRPYIPEEFKSARISGAATADKMNVLIKNSLQALKEVEGLDRRGNFTLALNVVAGEIRKVEERSAAAIELAEQMGKMAEAVVQVKPEKARQFALEAVSAQIAAITRLTAYNQTLAELFATLELRFKNQPTNPLKVEQLVEELNEQAKEINDLNEKFASLLEQFDAVYTT